MEIQILDRVEKALREKEKLFVTPPPPPLIKVTLIQNVLVEQTVSIKDQKAHFVLSYTIVEKDI